MAQQTPDPKLIDSMAMRYRHDFGLLEETHKEAIRTTMKQLWKEVVGLGFYKDEKFGNSEQLAQKTAVEWLVDQVEDFIGLIPIDIIQQAKEMFQQQIEKAHGEDRSYLQDDGSWKTINGEQYYTQTYGK
jgi:hypothetical protein